jgi:regulator of vacuolar morphogenesis
MSDKREGSTSPPPPKRPRLSYEDEGKPSRTSAEQPRNDAVYGQRGAFPGLDDGSDELFYGPADDGMEYLRMVRYVLTLNESSISLLYSFVSLNPTILVI